ncbi:hypothetical protein [Paracoccus jiaweipingae]|uniref:hypothetical protein n=1 Tax=Paracoccus sp. p2-l61 TaxID=3366950 RepID=UPI00379924BE
MTTILSELTTAVMPALLQVIAGVLAILLARAAHTAKARWGIEIEARHREALHSALMSGVRAALSGGMSGSQVIRRAIEHATESVPDAMRSLRPDAEVLETIAKAKLRDALAPAGVDRAK